MKISSGFAVFNKKPEEIFKESGCDKTDVTLSEFAARLFSAWKYQRKLLEKGLRSIDDETIERYASKIKNGVIASLVTGERKYLISLAEAISEKIPDAVVILANENGDIVAKSKKGDAKTVFENIKNKCSGVGGGRNDFCQGKIKDIDAFKEFAE